MFKGKSFKGKSRSFGQGMTEYAIIVAVIAIAAIGIFTIFGNVVKDQVSNMATEMAGNDGAAVGRDTSATDTSLGDYTTNNQSGGTGGGSSGGN